MRLIVLQLFIGWMCIPLMVSCAGATTQVLPPPPTSLKALPAIAWVRCYHDVNLDRTGVNLWELPAIPPRDPDSAYQGDRGMFYLMIR